MSCWFTRLLKRWVTRHKKVRMAIPNPCSPICCLPAVTAEDAQGRRRVDIYAVFLQYFPRLHLLSAYQPAEMDAFYIFIFNVFLLHELFSLPLDLLKLSTFTTCVGVFSLTGTHWVKSFCLPLFWMWLPWLLIEGASSSWAVNQQRMIICRVIICLSAVYILCSFDSGCFKVPGSIRYSLIESSGNSAIDFNKLIVFQDRKALDLLWFLFC